MIKKKCSVFLPNFGFLLAGIFLLWVTLTAATAADSLVWSNAQKRVDAEINDWSVERVLEQIAGATGWQVFVEPDTQKTVSLKFHNLPVDEAMGRLLGGMNFALLPQTNASSKLFVFSKSINEATLRVKPAENTRAKSSGTNAIPNELIVTLKPGSKQSIDELARLLGAKVTGRLDELGAYKLQFNSDADATAARSLLANNPEVAGVESNYSIDRPTRTDSLSMSGSLPMNLQSTKAGGPNQIIVGLVDTGIQSQEPSISKFSLSSVSLAGDSTLPTDTPTHATMMLQTIVTGMAQVLGSTTGEVPVSFFSVNVFGNSETTSTFDVANGIYLALKNGALIINGSLAGPSDSLLLQKVTDMVHQQGGVVIAAAGNEPNGLPVFPGADPYVTAVTAGDRYGNPASYANMAPFVDIIAPGNSIVSFNKKSYLVSGTSVSTAYVTGFTVGFMVKNGSSLASAQAQTKSLLSTPPKSSH
jgi:hypothetical protein